MIVVIEVVVICNSVVHNHYNDNVAILCPLSFSVSLLYVCVLKREREREREL